MPRPEKIVPTAEDRARAEKPAAEGWEQRSRKYRRLGRVPGGVAATDYMREHHAEDYARLLRKAAAALESDCRASVFHYHEESVVLTPGEFEAWLELRRASGDCVDWWTPLDRWRTNRASREIDEAAKEAT